MEKLSAASEVVLNESEDVEENDEEGEDDDAEEEDDEEPVDPMTTLREKCASTKACTEAMAKFEECEQRVRSRSKTDEKCTEEILDFFKCQDYCMAKDLFKHLK